MIIGNTICTSWKNLESIDATNDINLNRIAHKSLIDIDWYIDWLYYTKISTYLLSKNISSNKNNEINKTMMRLYDDGVHNYRYSVSVWRNVLFLLFFNFLPVYQEFINELVFFICNLGFIEKHGSKKSIRLFLTSLIGT